MSTSGSTEEEISLKMRVVREILKFGLMSVPVGSRVVVVDFFMQEVTNATSVERVQRDASVAMGTYISAFICDTKK